MDGMGWRGVEEGSCPYLVIFREGGDVMVW